MKILNFFNRYSYDDRERANRQILGVTYVIAALFIAMSVYFGWFLQFKSEQVIGNSYNSRLDLMADRVVRGDILSIDGKVLAETVKDYDGKDKRYYPYDYLFAHSVGYSGHNGKTGLESAGNFHMLSSHENSIVKLAHEFADEKSIGDRVVATLDYDMQRAASDAIGGFRGAVIAMEPDTGKILTMVSQPNFNANFVDENWQELIEDSESKSRLLNRATNGMYPPGSTFKILTALEFKRENPDTWQHFRFDCDGSYEVGEYTIKCFHGEAHGSQNLEEAFANSCNGAFAEMGLSLDKNRFKTLCEQCLFNSDLPYTLGYASSRFNLNSGSSDWEVLQTAIGQGKTQISPLHNLMIVSAIANGGTLMKPYMIDHVENKDGHVIRKFLPSSSGALMTASDAEFLTGLMKKVVDEGTASALKTDRYTAAGKTGSAEIGADRDTHSWFVGFAPAENPKIAICVIAEEGGSGGTTAARTARAVLDVYFDKY